MPALLSKEPSSGDIPIAKSNHYSPYTTRWVNYTSTGEYSSTRMIILMKRFFVSGYAYLTLFLRILCLTQCLPSCTLRRLCKRPATARYVQCSQSQIEQICNLFMLIGNCAIEAHRGTQSVKARKFILMSYYMYLLHLGGECHMGASPIGRSP